MSPLRRLLTSRIVLWAACAAALALFVAACAKNPVTGEEELVLMSERQEIAMGNEYYPQVIQLNHGLPPNDPHLQSYVTGLGNRLATLSHRPKVPWEFAVVNSSQVNAFALPGGKISVTRGLITKMSSEDELASVVGHEIGHVTARHAVAGYTRQILLSGALLGLALALGDNEYAPAALAAAGVAGSLMMLSYSRDQERQSDELGFKYMTAAGYNPMGAVKTFQLFKSLQKHEPGEIESLLSSHPLPRERIEAARQRALLSPYSNRPFKTARFNRLLARQKKRAPAYAAADRGNALAQKKQWPQAVSQYRRAISIYPREGIFHSRLALAQAQMKQGRAALSSARQGAKLSGYNFYPSFILGMVERGNRNYRASLSAHQRAHRLMPDHVINNFYLGYAYDRVGQRSQAIRAYREVAHDAPKSNYGQAAVKRLGQLGFSQ
ncbi:MAG: M48 family metalloprotease [Desulfarculaceae bacterium]|nr:M48 family metalloprotease [Desulfarculaceae bacterium]MCF8073093.1 M48 family metalloprotease [Desulfarculaceae bacterium]MCF8101822.1 M48 family metalloprotease [Desulfarculaceae bacterium]MCF8115349.1 M48 family metalloprotease [Desulfarculaceae bacterium]